MTKADFIQKVAEKAELTKKDTTAALDAVLESLTEILSKGESMTFVGFGTFSVSERAARTIKVPGTQKEMKIAARNTVKFKVGKKLKESVANGGKTKAPAKGKKK